MVRAMTGSRAREKRLARTPSWERPLWICPKCGNAFVNRNNWHSCVSKLREAYRLGGEQKFLRNR